MGDEDVLTNGKRVKGRWEGGKNSGGERVVREGSHLDGESNVWGIGSSYGHRGKEGT